MEEVLKVSMLLDFYGQLITKRQFEIMDLHYNNDYSLGEIAEQLKISRQGVFDNIRKARAVLSKFEKKLNLVEKHIVFKYNINNIIEELELLKPEFESIEKEKIYNDIINNLKSMIE